MVGGVGRGSFRVIGSRDRFNLLAFQSSLFGCQLTVAERSEGGERSVWLEEQPAGRCGTDL